jgi:putative DNA primase/helicase
MTGWRPLDPDEPDYLPPPGESAPDIHDATESDSSNTSRARTNRSATVRFDPSKPHEIADLAEQAIISAGFDVFTRGGCTGSLVEPSMERVPTYGGGSTQVLAIKEVEQHRLIDLMSQGAVWEKYDRRPRKYIACAPPAIGAAILLARPEWAFPRLSGVITTPTMRPDGSLLTEPGYDVATQLYLVRDPKIVLPSMTSSPSKADAQAALALLEGLLAEFPFADPAVDKSVALSVFMTPVLRAAMDVAPMHIVKAPDYGAGKSFLVNIASAIASGRPCPVVTAGADSAETDKKLDAALLKGQPIISIDNVNAILCSDKLAVAIEQRAFEVRVLGQSKNVTIDNRASIFATG